MIRWRRKTSAANLCGSKQFAAMADRRKLPCHAGRVVPEVGFWRLCARTTNPTTGPFGPNHPRKDPGHVAGLAGGGA